MIRENERELAQSKWAFFKGYICTCNADGSIPLNAKIVADFKYGNDDEAERIVEIHNELLEAVK